MWVDPLNLLTVWGAPWHIALSFITGFMFVAIDLLVRTYNGVTPIFHPYDMGYMLSEGFASCTVPIYGFALAFNPLLAKEMADKESPILAMAMFVTFVVLLINVFTRWSKGGSH